MLYSIHAVATVPETKGNVFNGFRTAQLPTFYLDSNVQGIVSADHAEEIALRMFASVNPLATVAVTAFAQTEAVDSIGRGTRDIGRVDYEGSGSNVDYGGR